MLTDENLEKLRDNCSTIRDLAMVDLLSSTGMRVGELVKLNREDVNFGERECIVFGKGNKERIVYFNARAKIHLQEYLNSRKTEIRLYLSHLPSLTTDWKYLVLSVATQIRQNLQNCPCSSP